ncbi:MAG TPA: glycosyl hydrolase-related protein [Streptosporangiaceae bacterium]|nr:glycosyl hydrolase-related protein [Streptosporangiaceae bacterium]
MPGAGIAEAIREGYLINLPERRIRGTAAVRVPALVAVDNEAVVTEAVKLADDQWGDVVVRLYESRGGRASTRLTADFPVAAATATDRLERPLARGRAAARHRWKHGRAGGPPLRDPRPAPDPGVRATSTCTLMSWPLTRTSSSPAQPRWRSSPSTARRCGTPCASRPMTSSSAPSGAPPPGAS